MEKEINRGRKKKEIDGEFAERLSKLLQEAKEKGIGQDNVARVIGVSRQSLGKWANGVTVPDILDLKKLANYFNVSADYLLGLSENSTTNADIQSVCDYTGLSETAVKNISVALNGNCVYCAGNSAQKIKEVANAIFSMPAFWKMISELIALEQTSYQIKRPFISSEPLCNTDLKIILNVLNISFNQFVLIQYEQFQKNEDELLKKDNYYKATKKTYDLIAEKIKEIVEEFCDYFNHSNDYLMFDKEQMMKHFEISSDDLRIKSIKEASDNGKHNPKKE